MLLWKLSARRLIQLAKRFWENDKELSQRVAPLGMVITTLCDELKIRHVERMSNGACGLEEGTVYSDILNSFTRISAHWRKRNGSTVKEQRKACGYPHSQLKSIPSDTQEYKTYLAEYSQKYELIKIEEHIRSMEPEEVE